MTSRIRTTLTAAATTVGLAAGLTGAAPLATASEPVSEVHLDDPTGDVYAWPGQPPTGGRSVDLVATDIQRLERRLVLRFTYDDLSRKGMRDWGVTFEIPRKYDHLYMTWTAGVDDQGTWSEYGWISRVDSADEFPVRCPALRGRADYDADTLTVRMPQACFPERGIVIEDLQAMGRRLNQGTEPVDSPFGDLDDPSGTRTPRLMAPAS